MAVIVQFNNDIRQKKRRVKQMFEFTTSMLQKNKLAMALLLGLSSQNVSAQQLDNHCDTAALECQKVSALQGSWYIAGELGVTKTSANRLNIEHILSDSQVRLSNLLIDESDNSSAVFLGYQLNNHLSFEMGYLDLGKRGIEYNGQTENLDVFFDQLESIYPISAKGLGLNIVASYSLSARIKASAKIGVFDWRGDYQTSGYGKYVKSEKITGQDIIYGIEVNYHLAHKWQAYVSYSRTELMRDKNSSANLGLRYYFSQN